MHFPPFKIRFQPQKLVHSTRLSGELNETIENGIVLMEVFLTMQTRFSLVLAALAVSTVAFAQDGAYQIGYAANLNIGDSKVNITNDGWVAGPFGNTVTAGNTAGNICANVYVFDPQEEEIGCCSCLITPDGLNSLSVQNDLISNNLTPAVPTSIVIKIVGSYASPVTGGALTRCDPTVYAGPGE